MLNMLKTLKREANRNSLAVFEGTLVLVTLKGHHLFLFFFFLSFWGDSTLQKEEFNTCPGHQPRNSRELAFGFRVAETLSSKQREASVLLVWLKPRGDLP